jgi:hypothetical protein
LPDSRNPCIPVCRNCGRDLVPDDRPPADRGRNSWRRACGCVIEPEPEVEFTFTEDELANFTALVAARNFEIDADFARHLLNSLAKTGTKVVVSLPERDIIITAEEAEHAIGRKLQLGGSP